MGEHEGGAVIYIQLIIFISGRIKSGFSKVAGDLRCFRFRWAKGDDLQKVWSTALFKSAPLKIPQIRIHRHQNYKPIGLGTLALLGHLE